ncbi:MAG: hypothetical protein ACE14U_08035 [Candidatus Velamenicoccus archaeovorus]
MKTRRSTLFFLSFLCIASTAFPSGYKGEEITYAISPIGRAEYRDLGLVDLEGRKLKLITFRTVMPGFDDLEKIYADPETGLPVRVERDISWVFSKENLTEEYAAAQHTLVIRKYIDGKQVKEYKFTADGPIHNAVLLPFYLRRVEHLAPGWSYEIRLPDVYKVSLASLDDIEVSGKKYKAYHFISEPRKFEIWISSDASRVPLVIKGLGGFGYTLQMKDRVLPPAAGAEAS